MGDRLSGAAVGHRLPADICSMPPPPRGIAADNRLSPKECGAIVALRTGFLKQILANTIQLIRKMTSVGGMPARLYRPRNPCLRLVPDPTRFITGYAV